MSSNAVGRGGPSPLDLFDKHFRPREEPRSGLLCSPPRDRFSLAFSGQRTAARSERMRLLDTSKKASEAALASFRDPFLHKTIGEMRTRLKLFSRPDPSSGMRTRRTILLSNFHFFKISVRKIAPRFSVSPLGVAFARRG